jgi:hypothetical protein
LAPRLIICCIHLWLKRRHHVIRLFWPKSVFVFIYLFSSSSLILIEGSLPVIINYDSDRFSTFQFVQCKPTSSYLVLRLTSYWVSHNNNKTKNNILLKNEIKFPQLTWRRSLVAAYWFVWKEKLRFVYCWLFFSITRPSQMTARGTISHLFYFLY